MFSTATTDPQSPKWFITHASNVTFPVLSGAPPNPTVVFFGFSSSTATPITAASNASAPLSNIKPALKFASVVFQVDIDLTIGENLKLFALSFEVIEDIKPMLNISKIKFRLFILYI